MRGQVADPSGRTEDVVRLVESEGGRVQGEVARQRRPAGVHVHVLAVPRQLRVGGVVPGDVVLDGREERCDRSRLQEEERTGGEGALDVDRGAALGLQREREARDLADLLVDERGALPRDRPFHDGEVELADGVRIGRDFAGRDRFAEAECRVDDDRAAVPADRIGRERDRRRVGGHELLDEHRDLGPVGDAARAAVRDRAI